jgi:amino acid transporter
LGTVESVVIAASSIAATSSIGIGMGVIAAVVGLHLPGVMLLGFLPIIGIAFGYSRLNQVEPNCGNGYVWVGRILNPWLGFLTGWVNIVGGIVFLSYTTTLTGSALQQLASQAHLDRIARLALNPDSTVQSTLVGAVVLIAVTVTAATGVAAAARLQRYLLVFEYMVLLGFCGYGLFAGAHPFSLSWFNPFAAPSFSALVQGLVLSVFCYWGFDASFSVTEEVGDPRQASRGGVISLLIMLALFLLAGTAFQRVLSLPELTDHGTQGLTYFGDLLAKQPLATLPLVALTFSLVASLQAGVIPTVRGMFAMSRDRTLGTVWSRVHPTLGTPAAGTVLVGVVAALVAALSSVIPKVSQLINATVNAIGIVVALYYALTALAAAARFRGLLRSDRGRTAVAVVAPALSAVALLSIGGYLCWTFYTASDHYQLDANNGWFELSVVAVILLTGLLAAAWAKWVRHSLYFTDGRDTDADGTDQTLATTGPGTDRSSIS